MMVTSAALGLLAVTPAHANSDDFRSQDAAELPAYLQCVPYARQISGVNIFGDAHTWWSQAASKYERGNRPKIGAVMAFKPNGKMQLGHVAAVVKILDARTVLLDHANWSPINGRRGQIERGVKAVDVSQDNDWSRVRVWYHPLRALGKTAWPVHGFIYGNGKAHRSPFQQSGPSAAPPRIAVSKTPSKGFLNAFSGLGRKAAKPAVVRKAEAKPAFRQAAPLPPRREAQASARGDVFSAVLAKYD